jgi:hypothetical protein
MALDVVQDYTKEVRRILQDAVAPYRYTDDNLVSALNMGLLEARRLRPDLFANNTYIQTGATSSPLRGSVPGFTAVDSTAVPMDPQYRVALVYYMCGQVQVMDEEASQDQRATIFLNKFTSQMLSIQSCGRPASR